MGLPHPVFGTAPWRRFLQAIVVLTVVRSPADDAGIRHSHKLSYSSFASFDVVLCFLCLSFLPANSGSQPFPFFFRLPDGFFFFFYNRICFLKTVLCLFIFIFSLLRGKPSRLLRHGDFHVVPSVLFPFDFAVQGSDAPFCFRFI